MRVGVFKRKQLGFAVLEAVLAVAVCGIMATSIAVAMQKIALLTFEAKRESALSRIIHNQVIFAATTPRLVEGKTVKQVEEWGVELETIITPVEDLVNQAGAVLSGLYEIRVSAVWWEDGEYVRRTSETLRNENLYAR